MDSPKENFDVDDILNKTVIDCVKEYPSLHYTNVFTESDEKCWDEIAKNTGLQKSWLKRRWKTIRDDHRKIIIYNHIHAKKVQRHKMAHMLNFLKVDLNGANKLDFEDLKQPKKASFCITQEMLDNCDISESITHESISIPKVRKLEPKSRDHDGEHLPQASDAVRNSDADTVQNSLPTNNIKSETCSSEKRTNGAASQTEANTTASDRNERCEDTIFGELVVAMLKKMNAEEKKRAKKEIMNILL